MNLMSCSLIVTLLTSCSAFKNFSKTKSKESEGANLVSTGTTQNEGVSECKPNMESQTSGQPTEEPENNTDGTQESDNGAGDYVNSEGVDIDAGESIQEPDTSQTMPGGLPNHSEPPMPNHDIGETDNQGAI